MNVAAFAESQAAARTEQTLAIVDGRRLSYGELVDGAARVAAGLRELGVERGDRVAVMMSTRAEFLFAWFGILGAGAIEVPIHDAARGAGIAYLLQRASARALIVDDEHAEHVAPHIGPIESLEHVIVVGEPQGRDARGLIPARLSSAFEQLLACAPARFAPVEPHEPASILFTGGTTGPPKGVVVSHNHNLNVAHGAVELFGYTASDVLYSVFPLFHANAKYMSVLTAIAAGAQLAIDRRFSATRFWETCEQHRITAFNGMGEMLRILLKRSDATTRAGNTVRMAIGAAAPAELVEQFEQRFGVAVLDVYGLTETGPVTAITWDERRPGSCGRPVPWYEVRVVDERDEDVPAGVTGEIAVRPAASHVMMEGYWCSPQATVEATRNLWFHTGDLARRDEDGFLWFVERRTDSIRRRGENVSAWEVEQVLAEYPQLLEAAVYGVPAELGGQEVMVAVVVRPGFEIAPEELLDHCTGKMPHFAVPRYVRFMDRLPRSHAQRVLKHELKAAGVDAPGVWDREAAHHVVAR